ncbi:SdpI family protein [Kitasatospora sp. NBC_01287]|uniref:SdpI family protein n=1 Tax=Kitasatospora sp. NBC_01287 TaxID=2903573 RepID=UPI00224DF14B|nr:SdpI family protein [Kitasatospora sp. NBC_01287]MCX4745131.1 SdpI family protein [Kitasatospora sp. NBC_01287]
MNAHLAVGVLFALTLTAAGLVIASAGRRAAEGRLPRNPLVGIRTRATTQDDDAWRAGQLAAQRRYRRVLPVLALAAIGSLVNGLLSGPFWVFLVIASGCGLADLVTATAAVRAARAAAGRR